MWRLSGVNSGGRAKVALRGLRIPWLICLGVITATVAVASGTIPIAGGQAPPCAKPTNLPSASAVQKRNYRGWFTVSCVPEGHTLSKPVIHWGDGKSSSGTVAYEPADASGSRTAIVVGEHIYKRATCLRKTPRCPKTLMAYVTATDMQAGHSESDGSTSMTVVRTRR